MHDTSCQPVVAAHGGPVHGHVGQATVLPPVQGGGGGSLAQQDLPDCLVVEGPQAASWRAWRTR